MTNRIDWKAVVWAGIIAGAVFMMLDMVLVATLGGGSLWGPPRMIAAMVMGREVLPPPANFALVPMMVAMMIHLVMSIILAVVLGGMISNWSSEPCRVDHRWNVVRSADLCRELLWLHCNLAVVRDGPQLDFDFRARDVRIGPRLGLSRPSPTNWR